jgi:hypothetical protein
MLYNFAFLTLWRPLLIDLIITRQTSSSNSPPTQDDTQFALACIKLASTSFSRSEDTLQQHQGAVSPNSWPVMYTLFQSVLYLLVLLALEDVTEQLPEQIWRPAVVGLQLLAACRCRDGCAGPALDVLKVSYVMCSSLMFFTGTLLLSRCIISRFCSILDRRLNCSLTAAIDIRPLRPRQPQQRNRHRRDRGVSPTHLRRKSGRPPPSPAQRQRRCLAERLLIYHRHHLFPRNTQPQPQPRASPAAAEIRRYLDFVECGPHGTQQPDGLRDIHVDESVAVVKAKRSKKGKPALGERKK